MLVKSVPILAFSFLKNFSLFYGMNSLVVIAFLDIEPLGASEMVFFMIMIHMRLDLSHLPISLLSLEVLSFVRGEGKSNFNARSRLMTARTIK